MRSIRPGFKHFEYVNPDAPKGGRLATVGSQGFDSFNPFILKGSQATGLSLTFDSLMERSGDEPDAYYGLIAETVDVAKDGLSVVFKLRPEAKFSDGKPITSEDVVWTFDTLKDKGHPSYALLYRDVTKAEALGPHQVRFQFKGELTRDLPGLVAGLTILPKHDGFPQESLKVMLGSGPYKIETYEKDRFIEYKRREDYWAKDLPVNRGRYNFDFLRFDSFRDRGLELEALKTGALDLREEFTAKDWVTGYEVDAVKSGRLLKLVLPDERPSGTQGFFMNARRAKLSDPRVRHAIDLAFDYEWTNKNLFNGQYKRTTSYFENSDLMARDAPSPAELALLEPFRAKLPPAAFGPVYVPPPTDGSGNDRRNLRQAQRLLAEAGWKLDPAAKGGAAGAQCQGRGAGDRIPDRRVADDGADHRALHQPAQGGRDCGFDPARRPGTVRVAAQGVRLRHRHQPLHHEPDAGDRAQHLLCEQLGQLARKPQSRRHQRSEPRCADRQGDRRQEPRRTGDGHAGHRPGPAGRTLLGAALAQGVALDRLLGQVRRPKIKPRYARGIRSTRGGTIRRKLPNSRRIESGPFGPQEIRAQSWVPIC